MYRILRPEYFPVGNELWGVRWIVIGFAESMEVAKALAGGYPVLEEIK